MPVYGNLSLSNHLEPCSQTRIDCAGSRRWALPSVSNVVQNWQVGDSKILGEATISTEMNRSRRVRIPRYQKYCPAPSSRRARVNRSGLFFFASLCQLPVPTWLVEVCCQKYDFRNLWEILHRHRCSEKILIFFFEVKKSFSKNNFWKF